MVKRNGDAAGGYRSPIEFSIEELDRELIARGARIPEKKRFHFKDKEGTPERDAVMRNIKELYDPAASPSLNKALAHLDTWQLIKALICLTGEDVLGGSRGIWGVDDRIDAFQVDDEQVRKNVDCTAAIFMKNDLSHNQQGFSKLRVKGFGKTFNLCDYEPFYKQPIAAGHCCTGFLVKDDVIATAAHFVNGKNVEDLRIVFGYKMQDASTPITRLPDENIYKGVKIIHQAYKRMGNQSDWALVQLDRKVTGQAVARLSKDRIFYDQAIYVIGHPLGLPLKYAPAARITKICNAYFLADLDVYSGNSGSPVFDTEKHKVIGMVVRGDNRDFRWTGKGLLSVIYPNTDKNSKGAQCTRVSEFINIVEIDYEVQG